MLYLHGYGGSKESRINRLHDHPYLKLRGKGTAVAVIDSKDDYQNEVFRNAGGSRIAYLWDQSAKMKSKISLDGSWKLKMEMQIICRG